MRPVAEPLPTVVEVKRTLAGAEKTFACELLEERTGAAVLRYVTAQAIDVCGVHLPAGTVTYGHFWTDRPYNVYHFQTPAGATIALYVNVADRTRVVPGRVEWRDLVVDGLVRPDGTAELWDLGDLPAGVDAPVRRAVGEVLDRLAGDPAGLLREVESASARIRAIRGGQA